MSVTHEKTALAKPYSIIYADPPWWYSSRSANRKTRFGGGARAHYDVMRDAEILDMAECVKSLAAENCALCLWATCPRLDLACQVVKAWGFRYCTVLFHWSKTRKNGLPIWGPGMYTMSNLEVVLLGAKGKLNINRRGVKSGVFYPRMTHSEKPPIVRDRIVELFGDVPRIELFARHEVEGWDTWGSQAGKLEIPNPRIEALR